MIKWSGPLRLRVRPTKGEDVNSPGSVVDAEVSGARTGVSVAVAVSVNAFRLELQEVISRSVQLAVATTATSEPEPEPEEKPAAELAAATKPPPEYAEAVAALRHVDSEGAWPAASPRCRRRSLAVANAAGEMMVLGVDPDSRNWLFRCRHTDTDRHRHAPTHRERDTHAHSALTAVERALAELTAVLRRLEAKLRRQVPGQVEQDQSTTIIVTRNAVLKPHRLQDIFAYGVGRSNNTDVETWLQEDGCGSLALIVALGDFEGGELSVSTTNTSPGDAVSTFDIRYNPLVIDGEHTLCSSVPFCKGTRYTVAYFTPQQVRTQRTIARRLTPTPDQLEAAVQQGRGAVSAARVAIVVPYRAAPGQSRERQLAIFSASLSAFFEEGCQCECGRDSEQIDRDPADGTLRRGANAYGVPKELGIFVIEQSADERRFNKGMLLNVVSVVDPKAALPALTWPLSALPAHTCVAALSAVGVARLSLMDAGVRPALTRWLGLVLLL